MAMCADKAVRAPFLFGSALWDEFNGIDFGIFDLADELDLENAIGHLHRNRFDIRAVRPSGFDPEIKVLEFVAVDLVGKNTLARPGNAFERFSKMKFGQIFAVRSEERR